VNHLYSPQGLWGRLSNLRRIGNPTAALAGKAANTGWLAAPSPRRISNPPRRAKLPHKQFPFWDVLT